MKTKSILPLTAALWFLATPAGLHGQVTTYVSPVAHAYDEFGSAVAAVGADRVLIGDPYADTGAENAGAAYLFDLAGNLIRTYANPSPAKDDNFGNAVAGVGTGHVLIAAWSDDSAGYNAGIVYLFDLNGQLVTTYTNPNPASYGTYFGCSVTGVGTSRVFIGATTGRAYLYDLAGNRVATCINPHPLPYDSFGSCVAAVGTDRLLVTAHNDGSVLTGMGVAYLYDLAGNLVTTFTNPTPAENDSFGYAATGVGNDRVLISATRDNTGAQHAGAAYLFDLAGNLIKTYTNPAPAVEGRFGSSVAAAGNDLVLIGAQNTTTGVTGAGVAYLFSTSGTLLRTFTNSSPKSGDRFGCAVAGVGSERVLIAASDDSTAAQSAGAAYLFSLLPPTALRITLPALNTVLLAWPAAESGYRLEQNADLSTGNWQPVTTPPVVVGAENQITLPATPPRNFFRLRTP